MIDLFVVLTPILLLGVIALLGFVGCDRVLGLTWIPPVAPTNLRATPGNAQVTLEWDSGGAYHFRVSGGTTPGGPYTPAGDTDNRFFIDHPLPNGTTFYYIVQAFDSEGTGGNSNEASATPFATPFEIGDPPGSQRATTAGNVDEPYRELDFPTAVTQGNLLLVAGVARNLGGAPTAIAVADDFSPAQYTVLGSVSDMNFHAFIAFKIAEASSPRKVRVTPAINATISFAIDEFGGVDQATPLDVYGGLTPGSSTTPSGSVTPTTATALLVGVLTNTGNGVSIVSGANYTEIGKSQAPPEFSVEFGLGTIAQPYIVNWTQGAPQNWAVHTAAFRVATG